MSSQLATPNCVENCQQPHTLRVAAYLLGCSLSKLYDLMNAEKIAWISTDYGRRIFHADIANYLNERTRRASTAETYGEGRKINRA